MDASEYELEFDPTAFYQFMLQSETFRLTLTKSEKMTILRQQRKHKSEPRSTRSSQVETECCLAELEST